MLRRTKCDSQIGLDLPPKKETVFSVPLTELQLGWYRTILTGVDESILLGSIEQEESQSSVVPMTDSIVESMTAAWETDRATNAKRRSHITTNTLMELRKVSRRLLILEGSSNHVVLDTPVSPRRRSSQGVRYRSAYCRCVRQVHYSPENDPPVCWIREQESHHLFGI